MDLSEVIERVEVGDYADSGLPVGMGELLLVEACNGSIRAAYTFKELHFPTKDDWGMDTAQDTGLFSAVIRKNMYVYHSSAMDDTLPQAIVLAVLRGLQRQYSDE